MRPGESGVRPGSRRRGPHAFPFEWVDRRDAGGRARLALTQTAAVQRGRGEFPPILALEILAQAGLGENSPDPASPRESEATPPAVVHLAGLDQVRFHDSLAEAPLRAGDLLEARVEEVAKFGKLRKLAGRLERDGVVVVEAMLLLSG